MERKYRRESAVHYRRETDWQDNSDQGIWKNEYEHFAEINFVTDEKAAEYFQR